MSKLISRNTAIPVKTSQIFSTASNNQNIVAIRVYEGERAKTKDNHLLGKFDLTGIPSAPRGVPQIEVTFEIDANGILQVSAEDKVSGNKKKIVITNDKNRLNPEDIERMVKDAEKFAAEDENMKKRIKSRNKLESYVYGLQGQVHDNNSIGGKLTYEDKQTLEKAIMKTIKWLDNNPEAETDDNTKQKKELEAIMNPIITKLYQGTDTTPNDDDDDDDDSDDEDSDDHDEL
ncbi:hypothetical protein Pmani_018596 [Petrolisthes manimaculis]|uniref:Heat shock protein 70 n=1 Tax=Petrolisthes manimaculis TaxID=1843537 RepID=A0AAE1PL85_9EUCA|nr:hypothetical protein Pmani_018596 [Petrolisthes manimaculis]